MEVPSSVKCPRLQMTGHLDLLQHRIIAGLPCTILDLELQRKMRFGGIDSV